jgi:hypothetical protein
VLFFRRPVPPDVRFVGALASRALLFSALVCRAPAEGRLHNHLQLFADASALLNQAALMALAALLGGVGALLAGNRLYWRFRGKSLPGSIAGVRHSGGLYYPVYRYKSPTGKPFQATCDAGVSRANAKLVTGRKLRVLYLRKHPDRVAEGGVQILEAVGWVCLMLAGVSVGVALGLWPVRMPTWVMLAGVVSFVVCRLRVSMPHGGERPFTSLTREAPPEGLLDLPVTPIEEILAGPVRAERQRQQRIAGRIVTPILVAAGVGVFALGAELGRTNYLLQANGERVRGTVLFSELKKTLHGSSYYPVVQFVTRSGVTVQFRDKMGDNPAAFREGAAVDIQYFPAAPEGSARIDHGVLNWLAPAILCIGGVFLAVAAFGARLGVPRAPHGSAAAEAESDGKALRPVKKIGGKAAG